MKVGTDGVLLGAWVRVLPTDRRILDIGTGTGVIALMLAQRTQERPEVRITAIDVGEVCEARANADSSPWGSRVETVQCPVQRFAPSDRFDLIVSNPPFFVDSLTSPDAGRTRVRHAEELPFDELHDAVVRLLAPSGRFALVLPPVEAELFLERSPLLRVVRRTEVCSTPRRGVRRVLLELVRKSNNPLPERLTSYLLPVPPFLSPVRAPAGHRCGAISNTPANAVSTASRSLVMPSGIPVMAASIASCSSVMPSAAPATIPTDAPWFRISFPLNFVPHLLPSAALPPTTSASGLYADGDERDTLTIGTGAHEEYTEEYRMLTRDFYLKF